MRILMVTMKMDIGGAETHIVELSTALAARGHTVVVASAGGVYTRVLSENGIRHVELPLDRKTPHALLSARCGLETLIRAEGFDLVHAHARIPAFLCGMLKKKLGFRFVTTDHGAFRVDPLLKRLTSWGEYTFAVSEDIRRYLIENYDISPAHIALTVNGINTKTFSPERDGKELRQALCASDETLLLHVSRLDSASSLAASVLMDTMPFLCQRAVLVIVGDGDHREALCDQASCINKVLGREAIRLVGARTNVADYIAACDLFVGPSRAAMEALACGKPTVISGSEGHGGVFEDALIDAATESNFCFRGNGLPTAEKLSADIDRLLCMEPSERERLGARGRSFILENYSIEKMVSTQLAVYEKIVPYRTSHPADIVICGYYGYGNVGDESMLASLVDGIRRIDPTVCICVMSARPEWTKTRYLVDAVWRFDLAAIREKLLSAKLFLFGGGNLLQDRTSTKSLMYYTKMLSLAGRCGTKILVYANGIGPITREINLRRIKSALSLADSISLRDRESFDLVKKLLPEKNIRLTFDPAITVAASERGDGASEIFTVIPKKNTHEAFEKLARLTDHIRQSHALTPRILCLFPAEDLAYCRRLAEYVGAEVMFDLSDAEIVDLLSRSAFVLSARLHGLIFATSACVPMMSFSDDGKLASYLDYIGFGEKSDSSAVAEPYADDGFLSRLADRLIGRRDAIRARLSAALPTYRVVAEYEFSEAVHAVHDTPTV